MQQNKMDKILDNYINGNLSDFRQSIKWLTKVQLIELVQYNNDQEIFIDTKELLQKIYIHLTIK